LNTQRCSHKEVSGDYKNLASCILTEVLAIIQQPCWSIASVLFGQFVINILKQVNALDVSAGANTIIKRDTSYTTFLLDLLGIACTGMRSITITVDKEKIQSDQCVLAPSILVGINKKIAHVKHTWLSTQDEDSGTPISSTSSSSKTSSAQKRKQKDSSSTLGVLAALDMLLEVSSFSMDALGEQPTEDDYFHSDDPREQNPPLASIPSPWDTLKQLTEHADLYRY
jgi:hypothetical protein